MIFILSSEILDILEAISRDNHGLILTKSAEAAGISRTMLSKLCKRDVLSRIAPGQYVFSNDLGDEMLSLSKRSKFIVFSHESALFLNGISERTPFEHSVTIPSSKKLGLSMSSQCKIYYVRDELMDLGKTMLPTPHGNLVPAYDLERTVCDIIRSRNKMATETFISALKLYAASPKKNLIKLYTYTEAFKMTSAVRTFLEVLL